MSFHRIRVSRLACALIGLHSGADLGVQCARVRLSREIRPASGSPGSHQVAWVHVGTQDKFSQTRIRCLAGSHRL